MISQELKKTLWTAADKLRSNMDAAEYKHVVLGLIFLKYVSDTFSERQSELRRKFTDPKDEYYLPDQDSLESELEDRDYYTEANVFWVPESARWENIRNNAKQPHLGKLIDDALVAIETENPRLKNILDKRFARTELEPDKLGALVDLISKVGFGGNEKARDVLGEVYEYFLGQFATAEGKKGGQFYTPASVVKVIVAILAPHKGKVYDPCCGSGGMFVQSEKFIESHGGRFGDISIYGQEGNPTTWRLVAMNLAIRGMDFNLGKEPADTFTRDQHPDLRADYIMANPPFNISDWWNKKLAGDARWEYGTPPTGNANYAWLSHILYHLKPSGLAGVVLANGSMSSNQNNEGAIRKEMIERDVVDCMIALPPQLFFNTQIPACLWFLTKDKRTNGRDRRGEILFIDARKLGRMETRVTRVFDEADIAKIAAAYHAWRTDGETSEKYQNEPGFVYAAKKEEVQAHDYVLTPGRYVGAEEVEEDEEAFIDKMQYLTTQLADQMQQSQAMDDEIRRQLARVAADGVVDIFAAAGLKNPNIGLLSDEFLNDVRLLPQKNLAVELLERLLRNDIKARFKNNVVQNKKFTDLLQQSLNKYRNRAIETAQVIEELIAMAQEFKAAADRGENLGLSVDEMAFYDALETNQAAVRELGDDILRKIAAELTDQLRKNVSVDWSVRDTVRAKLRLLVKRILRKYKYPPDLEQRAIALVLQQAETLSEAWM